MEKNKGKTRKLNLGQSNDNNPNQNQRHLIKKKFAPQKDNNNKQNIDIKKYRLSKLSF